MQKERTCNQAEVASGAKAGKTIGIEEQAVSSASDKRFCYLYCRTLFARLSENSVLAVCVRPAEDSSTDTEQV